MISISKLNKTYVTGTTENRIFDGLSVEFPGKGIIAICGESGCGKTTLLNCIGGLDSFSGLVNIDGHEMGRSAPRDDVFRQTHMGFVFQDYNLIDEASVKDNLQAAIDIAATSSEKDDERIKSALAYVGMEKYLKRKIKTLSGGQKQRVAIARAVINSPQLLLADEPTGHLDNNNSHIVMNILKSLSEEIPVIWVSHEKDLVNEYADVILNLPSGILRKNTKEKIVADEPQADKSVLTPVPQLTSVVRAGPVKLTVQYTEGEEPVNLTIVVENGILKIVKNESGSIGFVDKKPEVTAVSAEKTGMETGSPPVGSDTVDTAKEPQKKYTFEKVEITGKARSRRLNFFGKYSKKWLYLVSIITASVCMAFSISLGSSNGTENALMYLSTGKNVVQLESLNAFDENALSDIESTDGVSRVLPYFSNVQFLLRDGNILQTQNGAWEMRFTASVLPLSECGKIKCGRLPENPFEVCIDVSLAQGLIDGDAVGDQVSTLGYTDLQNYIGSTVYFSEFPGEFRVTGITDGGASVLYFTNEAVDALTVGLYIGNGYTVMSAKPFAASSGLAYSLEDDEIVISSDVADNEGIATGEKYSFNMKEYTVADILSPEYENLILLNEKNIKSYIQTEYYSKKQVIYAITTNLETAITCLSGKGYNAISATYLAETQADYAYRSGGLARRIVTCVIMLAAGVMFLLSEKGRILSDKKKISVYRCLGMTGKKLMATHMLEVLCGTSVIAVPVYSASVLLLNLMSENLDGVISITSVSVGTYLAGLVIILAVSETAAIIAGRKTWFMKPALLIKEAG